MVPQRALRMVAIESASKARPAFGSRTLRIEEARRFVTPMRVPMLSNISSEQQREDQRQGGQKPGAAREKPKG